MSEAEGALKEWETVSQLCPAGTVSGCAPVVSEHERGEEEEEEEEGGGVSFPES